MTLADILAAANDDPAFAAALSFTLPHEGIAYENVPGDPGGATEAGITHIDYDAWRKEHGLPVRPVSQITPAEIAHVYRDHYWTPLACAKLPAAVALEVFDCGVNTGKGRAAVWLQGVVGVKQDGSIGPTTLTAVQAYVKAHGSQALALSHLARRRAYYNDLAATHQALSKFLKGWLNRCDDVEEKVKSS